MENYILDKPLRDEILSFLEKQNYQDVSGIIKKIEILQKAPDQDLCLELAENQYFNA